MKTSKRTLDRPSLAAFLAAFHTAVDSYYLFTYELYWLSQPSTRLDSLIDGFTPQAWKLYDKWIKGGKKPLTKRDIKPFRILTGDSPCPRTKTPSCSAPPPATPSPCVKSSTTSPTTPPSARATRSTPP